MTTSIEGVVSGFLSRRDPVAPADLCEARDAGPHLQRAAYDLALNGGAVRREHRPRPDKAHIAFEDRPELGKLINAGTSQEATDRRVETSRVNELFTSLHRRVDAHRPEFRHQEVRAAAADARGLEQRWALARHLY